MIPVLDKGYVRLVGFMGDDLAVVRSARVSYDADWRGTSDENKDERLLRYLYRNQHTSPFEAVQFTFEVKAPLFVFRQWHRHRTWSYNEVSARYTEMQDEYYVPRAETIGLQANHNKQMRVVDGVATAAQHETVRKFDEACGAAVQLYRNLLAEGWPRELARVVLPLGMYSRMFASVNLNNLLKFLALREHEHAQWEMQQYAAALRELATPVVPTIMRIVAEERQG